MTITFILIGAAVGLLVDWALVERGKVLLGAFGSVDEVRYRELGVVRLTIVALSGGLVAYSQTHEHLLPGPFWTGVTMFLIADLYGVWKAVRS